MKVLISLEYFIDLEYFGGCLIKNLLFQNNNLTSNNKFFNVIFEC